VRTSTKWPQPYLRSPANLTRLPHDGQRQLGPVDPSSANVVVANGSTLVVLKGPAT
jgi:hypothetical protein